MNDPPSHVHPFIPPTIEQNTTGYDEYWVLEVHYNNLDQKAGLHDSTGMEVGPYGCITVCG